MTLWERLKQRDPGMPGNNAPRDPVLLRESAGRAEPVPEAQHRPEPQPERLSDAEKAIKQRVHDTVLRKLDLSVLSRLAEAEGREQIRSLALQVMNQEAMTLSAVARQRVATEIEDEMMGLGPIEPLLADKSVADVLINGWDKVFVERRGKLEKTDVHFRDNEHLMAIIERIVSRVGRRIDESQPMVDARLLDGSRVNAIIPPLAIDGPLLSIRRFTVGRLSMEELIRLGAVTQVIAELCNAIVRGRLNVLVSGGTGSGKTTLLNVLSGFIPPQERIVTIEDSAELQLQQPHVCRLETRPPNIEGRGEIDQRDLVRNCLRMRPDRIILGEVRGGEAFDMLQAMNTGHDGSLTTIHANTPRDAIARVENMVAMAGMELPAAAVKTQIASAINVVVQTERMEDGKRRVTSVQEVEGMEGNTITMSEIFRFKRRGIDKNGAVVGDFEATGMVPRFQSRLKARGIELNPAWFEPGRRSE
ncbi:MAG TPA: CpaF family protein [Verrucomicrobiae bacterium]|nr:CpaF family protein [Verrucomicrobiae bacterium]